MNNDEKDFRNEAFPYSKVNKKGVKLWVKESREGQLMTWASFFT